jgi:hypothetical protein
MLCNKASSQDPKDLNQHTELISIPTPTRPMDGAYGKSPEDQGARSTVGPRRRQSAENPRSASRFSINEKTEEQIKGAEALLAAGKPRQLMLIPTCWG